jgi:hypothetical protein
MEVLMSAVRDVSLLIGLLAIASCSGDDLTSPISGTVAASLSTGASTVVTPSGDTYVRQGHPNQAQGAEAVLRLQASGRNKALIQFSVSDILAEVPGSIVSVHLELTITDNRDNWGSAGRPIDLHLMSRAWSEQGATWNCAHDSDVSNSRADCESDEWELTSSGSNPWKSDPTASTVIHNGRAGVVSFNVTQDVIEAAIASSAQVAWVLKKRE